MKLFLKEFENYFTHSAVLLLQRIQILMKTINFSISYDNFCVCTKHFASHCKSVTTVMGVFLVNGCLLTVPPSFFSFSKQRNSFMEMLKLTLFQNDLKTSNSLPPGWSRAKGVEILHDIVSFAGKQEPNMLAGGLVGQLRTRYNSVPKDPRRREGRCDFDRDSHACNPLVVWKRFTVSRQKIPPCFDLHARAGEPAHKILWSSWQSDTSMTRPRKIKAG